MTRNILIRPAWTPATIALMVVGFMVFWPLGLAMLAYILWGDRLESLKNDVNSAADRYSACNWGRHRGRSRHRGFDSRTGNVAFDDWRQSELARLDEERQKLDEMRAEFDEYSRELRRAKDQDEFNAFMSRRASPDDYEARSGTVPQT